MHAHTYAAQGNIYSFFKLPFRKAHITLCLPKTNYFSNWDDD